MKNTQNLIEDTLKLIAQKGYKNNNKDFLKAFAEFLVGLFNVDYVLINTYFLETPTETATIIVCGKEGFLPNIKYNLKDTPCENVINKNICTYPHKIQQLFPKDELLTQMNVESYIGIPLWSSEGEPIGLIAILDSKPIKDTKTIETILQIGAIKAAQVVEQLIFKSTLKKQLKNLKISNSKIKESENKFKIFTNQTSDGYTVADLDGNYVFVNPAFCKMSGYTEKELLKMTVFDMKAKDQSQTSFYNSKSNMEGVPIRVNLQRKNGTEYLTEIVGNNIQIDNKSLVLGTIRDISEKVKIENELKIREQNYRQLFEENPTSLWEMDFTEGYEKLQDVIQSGVKNIEKYMDNNPQFLSILYDTIKTLQVNSASVNFFKAKDKEHLLANTSKLVTEETLACYQKILIEIFKGKTEIIQEVTFLNVSNEAVRGLVKLNILKNKAHNSVKANISIVDITEQKETEERYRGLSDASFNAIFISENGFCLNQNAAAEKMFGYTFDEAITMKATDLIATKDHKLVLSNIMSGNETAYEVTAVRKDGTTFSVEIQSRNATYKGRGVRISAFRDLSYRKELETSIKKSEEKFKKLSNLTFEGVLIHDNGVALDINRSFSKMFGYKSNELVGKNIINLLFPKKYHKQLSESITKRYTIPYEIEGIRKDGSIFPIEIEAREIDNDKDNTLRVSAIRDITKRKKLEAEIQKLYAAVEQSANTIVITDTEGNIEYTNPKFTELTKFSAAEALGNNPRIINSGKQPKEYYTNMWKTINSGNSWSGEFQNKSKCGTIFWEQATITPIKNNEGKIVNFLAVKEDITKRKEDEQKLAIAYETIKESEEALNTILKTVKEGFWLSSKEGNTIEVNPEMCKILGYKEEEILGKSIFEFVDNENAKIFKQQLKIRDLGQSSTYEIELQQKNGNKIPCLFKTSPLFNNEQERIGSFAMVTDISELKKAYETSENQNQELKKLSYELSEKNRLLLESSSRFENLFELSPVSIWEQDYSEAIKLLTKKKKQVKNLKNYLDKNHDFVLECIYSIKIVNVNKSTLDLIGVNNKDELLIQLRKSLSSESIKVLKKELLVIASDDGKELKETAKFIKTDGSEITTILKLVKINNEGKVIVTLNDITALKNAEAAVKKNEQKFRELYEKSGDAILIIKNGIFVECNKSAVSLLEYTSKDDFLNQHPSKLSPLTQSNGLSSSEEAEKMMSLALENGTHRFEWIHVKSNGDEFPVEVLLTAISNDPKNEIIHCVWRDITQRKKAVEELILAKEAAEESDRLKTEFLNNMSHEIRTPMNGILGFSQMLSEPDLEVDKRANFVKIIQSSGNQLLHVIDDIIEISRLGTQQVKLQEEEVCLNDVLLELFSIFDIKAKENKTPLYLKKALSDKQSTILTDKPKLNKVLSNLLENALKFTNNGFIEFGYTIKNNTQNPKLEIYVKDTGIGIKPEKHQLIFERFQQAEKDLSKKVGGLGLGLSIAKENTELLGGEISVESEMMEGATFYVTIPFKPIYTIDESKEKAPTYKILIAEDEEINYMYLETLLKDVLKLSCDIFHTKDGRETVEFCKNNLNIDFILMDLKMPVLNGFKATSQIRKFNANIPIIAQTAYSTIADKDKAMLAGCTNFISKPIDKEELFIIIENILIK